MLQPKDKDWSTGKKNKKQKTKNNTPIYAVYKRLTSNLGTRTD